jgi:hypothetical protein
MNLTRDQERMLEGEEGDAVRKAMELLVALGEVFGAGRLAPVESAHISGVSYKNLGDAGTEWLEEQAELGSRTRVRATLNPAGMDMEKWAEMGVPPGFAEGQVDVQRDRFSGRYPGQSVGVVRRREARVELHGRWIRSVARTRTVIALQQFRADVDVLHDPRRRELGCPGDARRRPDGCRAAAAPGPRSTRCART